MKNLLPGRLYLIPVPLGTEGSGAIPEATREAVAAIDYFIVENERSARRCLRSMGYKKNFDAVTMLTMNSNEYFEVPETLLPYLQAGHSVGVISEAGCPGIADPGAAAVLWAHRNGIAVVPLTGPSSIFLALMASGLNGQQFAFHGYLPVQSAARKSKLKQLEEASKRSQQTQIFMETPYRNMTLLHDILESCREQTLLCIAADITLPTAFILTQTVKRWKQQNIDLHKKPAIFLLQAQ